MKILNQNMIIQRLKSDAGLLGINCEFDVEGRVSDQLKNIEIIDTHASVKSPRPIIKKLMIPLVGATVLTLIAIQLISPMKTMDQTPSNLVLIDNVPSLISKNQVVIEAKAVNNITEKLALKEDMLFIAQVFSM